MLYIKQSRNKRGFYFATQYSIPFATSRKAHPLMEGLAEYCATTCLLHNIRNLLRHCALHLNGLAIHSYDNLFVVQCMEPFATRCFTPSIYIIWQGVEYYARTCLSHNIQYLLRHCATLILYSRVTAYSYDNLFVVQYAEPFATCCEAACRKRYIVRHSIYSPVS